MGASSESFRTILENGHALAMLPDLLWTFRRPAVQLAPLPGRPERRLFTGVRRGSAAHPAVRSFRAALEQAVAQLVPAADRPL